MLETISLDVGNPARSKPSAEDLANALSLSSVDSAADIIAASWAEIESYSGRLWGAREAVHRFRLVSGSAAETFPFRPIAESVTVRRFDRSNGWTGETAEYEPDGWLYNLQEGALYEVTAGNLGNLGSSQPPKNVLAAVLRLSAWRASHRGSMFLPLASGPTLTGYAQADAIRRSGAAELLAPHMHYGSGA